ncbi:hypothetical protein NEPAR06_2164 [Nematocida parisii]|uniref:uncharacterized protein n=1 Tax=Nematocida parisii (strain ERTm1 / ATCC PRA-289) TaxID=881290 RepID=UPI000264B9DC|nr:uncharacterized protein NEPG_01036 [Nematocida parisii ERTm1]EIJ94368.1 hypothetical protein NEPG_01036 [Nematocida parisii ERTm1]KAI5156357.1 hypothetical protein NEPAR06_2164 [Nematocida parisii]KAI5157775.1 hypothetical protein NEPAR05_1577 [Nematocida parisii]|eukprot:XP_013058864.1 hypothetical protein NEPG_01036 [Nematocida parisii ERTm1]
MKRLTGRKPAFKPILQENKESELPWHKIEGFSGWFIYKMSKYFSLGIFPTGSTEIKGRKLRARNKINLSKVYGEISVLDLDNISTVKGSLNNCIINTVGIKNTVISDELWRIIRRAKRIILNNVNIKNFKEENFKNATSIDILGSTVKQIGNRIIDLITINIKRVRIADKNILIFWDESKCSTCVIRYFDVYRIIQRIPVIRIIHFDGIEITIAIIKELRRHPITTVKLIGCRIHPIKIYDLVSTCEKYLIYIEFNKTAVPISTVEYLRSKNLVVTVL